MTNIEIEIDGKKLSVKPQQTIIEAADEAGIYIPRFCYHKHLSVAANCRMCLVEVEKSPKALPACATPVMPGMKVATRSKKTIEAQRAVMEFLLVNHPLDCPICDQGGECELQDLSMGYGAGESHFDECKRAVPELDLGPLIATEMTRCIHCTRCVRFGDEIAGLRELGATQRGEHTEISTFIQHAMQSEVSGNIIDLCPVGALTSKPYRFTARAWELQQAASISPHDAFGTNIYVHTQSEKAMRVVPKENAHLNQTWISDRDRFSYTALNHEDRLKTPLIKVNDVWQEASWEDALNLTVERLQAIAKLHGGDQLAGLLHPSSTLEEAYLMQKIIRGMGSPHIDHRLQEIDTQDQDGFGAFPGFDFSLSTLEESEVVLIVGSNVAHELPLLNLRLRQMAQRGTTFLVLNAYDYDLHFPIKHKMIRSPMQWAHDLMQMRYVFSGAAKRDSDHFVKSAVELMAGKARISIILGEQLAAHPYAAEVRFAAYELANACQAKLGVITQGANSAGAWLAGAIPHRGPARAQLTRQGENVAQLLKDARRAYLLLNVEPAFDVAQPVSAIKALAQAEFVVSLSAFRDPALMSVADVILPVGPFTETSGTYVNLFGEWQSFRGVAKPLGQARPAWKVLRVLGELLNIDDCQYDSSEAVRDELHRACASLTHTAWEFAAPQKRMDHLAQELVAFKEVPIYRSDAIVRRAQPLQDTLNIMYPDFNHVVKMHPETALHVNVQEGVDVMIQQDDTSITMRAQFDDKLALDVVWLAAPTEKSAILDNQMGVIDLK